MRSASQTDNSNAYQQLVTAVTNRRMVNIHNSAADYTLTEIRGIEPIGLYLSQHWHVIAYCRLRQAFRNFRLDRIQHLVLSDDVFAPRTETLLQYWVDESKRRSKEKVVIRFQPAAVLPALAQHLNETKSQYGWTHDEPLPDGSVEMLFFIGSLPYLATWLLPFAGAITVVEPQDLREQLSKLARHAFDFYCGP